MPIYEYECQDCGHHMDALQKVSDAPLTECPACGTDGLSRLVSAPRFRLKGSGWYETDFKKDNQRNLAEYPKKEEKKKSDDKDKASASKEAGGKSGTSSPKSEKKTASADK